MQVRRLPLIALLACLAAQTGHSMEIGWPDAVGRLTGERSTAEACVGSLKTYGNSEQIAQGRFVYGTAKADFDAVIAGLMTALAEDGSPEDLPSLEAKLEHGASDLFKLCKSVHDLMPTDSGRKGVIGEIAQAAIDPLIKALSEGVAALYNNHRNDSRLTRQTIHTQLEAAKWSDFGEVKAAQ